MKTNRTGLLVLILVSFLSETSADGVDTSVYGIWNSKAYPPSKSSVVEWRGSKFIADKSNSVFVSRGTNGFGEFLITGFHGAIVDVNGQYPNIVLVLERFVSTGPAESQAERVNLEMHFITPASVWFQCSLPERELDRWFGGSLLDLGKKQVYVRAPLVNPESASGG